MHSPGQKRKPQFSLRALLLVTTAVSLLLGIGYWIQWSKLLAFMCFGFLVATGAVTFWPLLFGILWKTRAEKRLLGMWVLACGCLLLAHLVATIVCVEGILRTPMLLDLHPYYGIMVDTLNWTVPSVAVGLLVAAVFTGKMRNSISYPAGCFLALVGLLGFIWYGHRFFTIYLGERLAEIVWWL